MLYQIGIILIIIVAAIIVSKRFNQNNDLIYEDEMSNYLKIKVDSSKPFKKGVMYVLTGNEPATT